MNTPQDITTILDVMCPMHVILDASGHIAHAGPTVAKLWGDASIEGLRFLETFELIRPAGVSTMQQLRDVQGSKLHLRMGRDPSTSLKGVLMPRPGSLPDGDIGTGDGSDSGGLIVNLSFGISILEGVRNFALTSADFAATDLTVEMLYLIEAKSAAMEASRKLNLRLQGAMIAAEEQAFTDTLSGLKNRRAVNHVLPRLISGQSFFAVMQLDLDFFKAVNDTFGHATGDHVLQQVARILVEETREEDCVARVGGDEFVLIFANLHNVKKLGDIAQRIIERVEKPIRFEDKDCRISASIGIAISERVDPLSEAQILADADTALYSAKNQGRGRYCFYEHDRAVDLAQMQTGESQLKPTEIVLNTGKSP